MANRTLKLLSLPEAEQAAILLGLGLSDLTAEKLRTAFRVRVRTLHPDTGAEMSAETSEKIQEAFQARAKLIVWLQQQPNANCTVCGGKGWIRSGAFNTQVCTSC